MNDVALRPPTRAGICDFVAAALKRSGLDATGVMVVAHDDRVALLGNVASREQRDAAERAAGSVPGAAVIENRLEIA